MKRQQQPTNSVTNTEISSVSENRNGKGKGARENNESSVSDAQNIQSLMSMLILSERRVYGKNGAAESRLTSNTNVNDNGNRYNLRSKNPPTPTPMSSDDDDHNNDDINTPKRIQQPPAYINSHLMKVKMECDYVPIVALKEESADEMSVVDKSEAEAELNEREHELFISRVTIPTSQVTSQNSGIGQQENQNQNQQDKEKVAVKVEADVDVHVNGSAREIVVTENETERQSEELNKIEIENLKEKIQEYAQQLNSLSREKTEIQTTLQNKINEQNLVVEQLKAEIRDLNSTMAHQRDENNRINAQLNLKQDLIKYLN